MSNLGIVFLTLAIAEAVGLIFALLRNKRLQTANTGLEETARSAQLQSEERVRAIQAQADENLRALHIKAEQHFLSGDELVRQELARQKGEALKIASDCQAELLRVHSETDATIQSLQQQIAALQQLNQLGQTPQEVENELRNALIEATQLRNEARDLMQRAKSTADSEISSASQRAKEIRMKADTLLTQATRDAGAIVQKAHTQAEQIAGDAYSALRDKEQLERACVAIRNVIDGYGDKYVVPTRSLLDELAEDFGHLEAGQALSAAREQSRRMVAAGEAATCDYLELQRKETAIRFVIDAFNGRVDAILTRTKHDNFGTLEQEIRDAFALVNLNGKAFKDARILPAYLDTRLLELKWAVVAQELRYQEREEQRRLKEQIREEEKARREYEKAMKDAQREEEILMKALQKAREEAAHATSEQKMKFEQEIAALNQKLAEAEARNQRALSMAQQTRKGNVYIISNVGSFGDDVLKIGMTRRLEPLDRIKELGDASVPFEFDVHAMIPSDDAPALENLLHTELEHDRVNQINYRKEFFRVRLDRLRELLAEKGIHASFTLLAKAKEYRESLQLSKMTPEEREKYWLHVERAEERNARAQQPALDTPSEVELGI